MSIEYVGGQVAGRANPSSALSVTFALTGGTGSTPAENDLVIVTAVTGSAAGNPAMAVTTPSGYTALGQLNQSAVTADTSMDVSYKKMTSTPDTTVTIPGTGNNAFGQAYSIQVFRGVDTTTPLDVSAVSAGGTATGRPDPASITPTTSGACVVICGGGAAGTGANYTAPTNYTTNFLTASGTDTTDAMVGSGYKFWTSGAENPAAYTGGTTGANDSWASYTLALRPASPAPKRFYFKDSVPSGATLHRSLQDGGLPPEFALTSTGWVLGTKAAGQSCIQTGGSVYAEAGGNWGTTLQPNAAPSQTIGDSWRTENTLTGTFASGDWLAHLLLIGNTSAPTGVVRLGFRLWRSTDPNGASATEITSGRQVTSLSDAGGMSLGAREDLYATVSLGSVSLSNEYLFINIGVEVTTASGATGQDTAYAIRDAIAPLITPNFTPTTLTTVNLTGSSTTISSSALSSSRNGVLSSASNSTSIGSVTLTSNLPIVGSNIPISQGTLIADIESDQSVSLVGSSLSVSDGYIISDIYNLVSSVVVTTNTYSIVPDSSKSITSQVLDASMHSISQESSLVLSSTGINIARSTIIAASELKLDSQILSNSIGNTTSAYQLNVNGVGSQISSNSIGSEFHYSILGQNIFSANNSISAITSTSISSINCITDASIIYTDAYLSLIGESVNTNIGDCISILGIPIYGLSTTLSYSTLNADGVYNATLSGVGGQVTLGSLTAITAYTVLLTGQNIYSSLDSIGVSYSSNLTSTNLTSSSSNVSPAFTRNIIGNSNLVNIQTVSNIRTNNIVGQSVVIANGYVVFATDYYINLLGNSTSISVGDINNSVIKDLMGSSISIALDDIDPPVGLAGIINAEYITYTASTEYVQYNLITTISEYTISASLNQNLLDAAYITYTISTEYIQ